MTSSSLSWWGWSFASLLGRTDMQYTAYRTQPTMSQNEKTGEWRFIRWEPLGIVESLEEAKKRYGGSPVLEKVKQ